VRFAQDNHMVNALLELRRAPRIAHRASEQLADDLTAAATPVAGSSDRASDPAGGYALLHDHRGVGSAIVEQGVTPKLRRTVRTSLFAVAAIGLASLPVFAGSWLLSSTAPPAPHASLALAGATADRLKTQVPSIAVLPFITRSEDAKLDYLADGITDSLISDLVRAMPGISVVSRGTEFPLNEDIFSLFGKLPIQCRLLPKIVIPVHASSCPARP
jgi:hypothetical protein